MSQPYGGTRLLLSLACYPVLSLAFSYGGGVLSAANKAKGTKFETAVVDYLQGQGYNAKRLPRMGVKDIGDVGLTLLATRIQKSDGSGMTHVEQDTFTLVIEAKDRAQLDWPTFLEEAEVEATNYEEKHPKDGWTVPVVVAKRRRQGIHRSYVMFELDTFVDLLKGLGL